MAERMAHRHSLGPRLAAARWIVALMAAGRWGRDVDGPSG